MHVRNRNATHDRADDPDKPLIGAAQKEVLQVRGAIELAYRALRTLRRCHAK